MPRHLFVASHEYTVHVVMSNRYLDSSASTVGFVATELPMLSVVIPQQMVDRRAALLLSGQIAVPNCTSQSLIEDGLFYQWEVLDGPPLMAMPRSWTARRLHLPPYSLSAGATYKLQLSVFSGSSARVLAGLAEVKIVTDAAKATAHISGGNRQVSRASNGTIVLDGGSSHDGVGTGLIYAWSCISQDGDTCFESSAYRNGDWFHDQRNLTLLPSKLLPGFLHFTLAVRSSSSAVTTSSTTASTVITCVSEDSPTVAITNPTEKVSSQNTFVIRASTASSIRMASQQFSWSAWPNTAATVNGSGSFLVIMPNTMNAGHIYRFTVHVHDGSNGLAGEAFVDVLCNSAPTSGVMTASPSSGHYMTTDFRAVFSDWRDDDLPLTYALSLQQDGTVEPWSMSLTGRQSSSSISFSVPTVGAVGVVGESTNTSTDPTPSFLP